jgi:hypothetical protein
MPPRTQGFRKTLRRDGTPSVNEGSITMDFLADLAEKCIGRVFFE